MRKGALIGALVLGLMSVSLNVNAYHIIAGGGPMPHGPATVQGTWRLGALGPLVVICESNSFGGSGVPKEGEGGLCFMSPGCLSTAAGPPAGNGNIRSNGLLPDEVDGVAAVCGTAANFTVPFGKVDQTSIVDLDMDEGVLATTAEVGWTANIIDFCNIPPTWHFRYNEKYAYWVNNGHVTGFIDPVTASGPTATGSYAVDDTGNPAPTGCDNDVSNPPPASVEPTEDVLTVAARNF